MKKKHYNKPVEEKIEEVEVEKAFANEENAVAVNAEEKEEVETVSEDPVDAVGDEVDEQIEEPKEVKVKVDIDNLNIRKGPGIKFERTGKFTGKGIFVISEIVSGEGSKEGWGKLESGEGWISLHFCEVIK